MASETVRFALDDGLAWITLDRPQARNAIDDATRDALVAALARVADDAAVRAAVLTASGDDFCTGADLWTGRAASGPAGPGHARRLMQRNSQRLLRTLIELEKPILAAVNGVAAGLGAHLALACDLVIAAEEARFVEVFARRGLAIDAAGAFLLSRLVGLQKAKELVFFADAVPAREALALGLCNKVVPRAELAGAARAWGERLAAGPTFALGLSKRLLTRAYESSLATSLDEEAFGQALVAQSADVAEGLSAFAEKRPPRFQGR